MVALTPSPRKPVCTDATSKVRWCDQQLAAASARIEGNVADTITLNAEVEGDGAFIGG